MRNKPLPGLLGLMPEEKKSPMTFKGADASNSKCWPGYKKVGTKKSPSGTGKIVNDCEKI
jgi:hypothetical protein